MTTRLGVAVSMLGRSFTFDMDEDDDGTLYGYYTCDICDGVIRGGDDALQDHECPDTLCPRCDGEGRIGWNPTSNGDPQHGQDAECPLCRENCVVTLAAAEAYLDRALVLEDEFGGWADGWTARNFNSARVHTASTDAWASPAAEEVPW